MCFYLKGGRISIDAVELGESFTFHQLTSNPHIQTAFSSSLLTMGLVWNSALTLDVRAACTLLTTQRKWQLVTAARTARPLCRGAAEEVRRRQVVTQRRPGGRCSPPAEQAAISWRHPSHSLTGGDEVDTGQGVDATKE